MFFKRHKTIKKPLLSYTFIDNSILLSTSTINKNGFYEVWRQENSEHSTQILCFNPETAEFLAFDKFHRMIESTTFVWEGVSYEFKEKDLWTPIKLHFTLDWLQYYFKGRS